MAKEEKRGDYWLSKLQSLPHKVKLMMNMCVYTPTFAYNFSDTWKAIFKMPDLVTDSISLSYLYCYFESPYIKSTLKRYYKKEL